MSNITLACSGNQQRIQGSTHYWRYNIALNTQNVIDKKALFKAHVTIY